MSIIDSDPGPVDAWSSYWASGNSRGCLPNRSSRTEETLRGVWQHFASLVPPGAQVLDVATGSGVVPRWMQEVRSDLRYQGIDYVRELPKGQRGIQITGGIDVTKLPYAADSFAAITSQFGIEYAPLNAALPEIARVLEPGGRAVFVMHQAGSPIERGSRARADALSWVIPRLVAASSGSEPAGEFVTIAQQKFPKESPAWEIAEALKQARAKDWAALDGIHQALLEQARYELLRLNLQFEASSQAGDENIWRDTAANMGLEQVDRMDLSDAQDASRVFAVLRSFIRI